MSRAQASINAANETSQGISIVLLAHSSGDKDNKELTLYKTKIPAHNLVSIPFRESLQEIKDANSYYHLQLVVLENPDQNPLPLECFEAYIHKDNFEGTIQMLQNKAFRIYVDLPKGNSVLACREMGASS